MGWLIDAMVSLLQPRMLLYGNLQGVFDATKKELRTMDNGTVVASFEPEHWAVGVWAGTEGAEIIVDNEKCIITRVFPLTRAIFFKRTK